MASLSSLILIPSFALAYVFNPNFANTTSTLDTYPPYISLVSLSNVTVNGVTITWSTNELSDTQTEFCLSYIRCGNLTPLNSTLSTQHVVVITGMSPGTYYNIWPLSKDAAGNVAASYPKAIITLSVSDTVPPTVVMTAPANGADVNGSTVAVSANAQDNVGVHSVSFYRDNGVAIGFEDSTLPYLAYINTANLTVGLHTIYAIATDRSGNSTRSASVTVNVVRSGDNVPPFISLVSVSNITATSATMNWMTNEPADTQVEFCTSYIRCGTVTLLNSALSTQHSVVVTGMIPGTYYYLWPLSKDAAGNVAATYPKSFNTMSSFDLIPPTVFMTAPSNGANVTGYTVPVSAVAQDNVGVYSVRFFRDNDIIIGYEDSTLPYSTYINTANLTPGPHAFYAIATDRSGNSTRSASVTVNILPFADTVPPYLSLLAISNVTTNSATIIWTTSEPSDTQVEVCQSYIRCGNFTPLNPTLTTQHSVTLAGLNSGTYYNVWASSRDAAGNLGMSYPRAFITLR